jgi:hypothetical protein
VGSNEVLKRSSLCLGREVLVEPLSPFLSYATIYLLRQLTPLKIHQVLRPHFKQLAATIYLFQTKKPLEKLNSLGANYDN